MDDNEREEEAKKIAARISKTISDWYGLEGMDEEIKQVLSDFSAGASYFADCSLIKKSSSERELIEYLIFSYSSMFQLGRATGRKNDDYN